MQSDYQTATLSIKLSSQQECNSQVIFTPNHL